MTDRLDMGVAILTVVTSLGPESQ
ncbi:hypothetical protein ACHAW5_008466 [Stephanodiscus triporus]|uniref:Uncharacterized protein n=1 Tax=Stephanodiscus triporus TaxID=2934178 RepID=A0ABD3PDP9_9STRA